MSPENLKEAKSFRNQMLVCSMMCWFVTILLLYVKPEAISEAFIIPGGATVFTIIYFNMKSMINKYESKP